MHHVAIIAADYDAALEFYVDNDFSVASSGAFGEVRFCYMDTSRALGHMIEILEDKPAIRTFFDAIAKAAERWDGDPATLLRELG